MAATKKKAAQEEAADPTLKSDEPEVVYPEGTHAPLPVSETHHSAERIDYQDNPDKPDPTTVAQIAVFPEDWGI